MLLPTVAIQSDQRLKLDLPPSCVQFCPARPHLFVVGSYYLHPVDQVKSDDHEQQAAVLSVQKRSGSLVLFRLLDGIM